MSPDQAPAGRGRPRDPRTEQAITDAARRLLAQDGYDQVSIEAIAREADVSRPTVYRRWPSKTHLVFDAVFGAAEVGDVLASSGDFDADLRRFVAGVFDFWRAPEVAAAALGILADRHRDPELFIRTQQLLDENTRAAFGELVRAGIDQGVLDADADVEIAYDALVGTSFYIAQVLAAETVDAAADRLCSLLLQGMRKKEDRDE
ncbi:TetR/AcrR family transcriptional regulator [Mycolicibacter kumamotonensis]|uniref:TetR family transcriptional regulator n=1 Tax=Mycolicibacter kumamotonensis TaxID=354243 RepID=A0A1B8SA66_9MYCO|nr:TetR/AcrR family transcriptional regulator [Mycolicibacter kumamotonensis]OBY29600.1 TetR family transcriptional regulator [Mycolicibacter kumamotonensis]ORA75268.1 TetR family transcriptional regulator [Mycolicibacter kumamotonensis]